MDKPEPAMPKNRKPRTLVHLTAMWGNGDADSSIKVSRRRWHQIQSGEPYDTTTWSWYEGKRTLASWSFRGGELTISLDDGMECYFSTIQLYVGEVTSKPSSSQ